MKKNVLYIVGLIALGIVIFNNVTQLSITIRQNPDYITGLLIALIMSIFYGIINIK